MYQPPHFRETRLDVMQDLVRAHPLGLLISAGHGGLMANPIPFQIDADRGEMGVLQAHLSKANPQWRALAEGAEALVVFQGAQSYITPSWYETKRETGKVVPTWNYAIVQARGTARVIEDEAWLHAQIRALTNRHEGKRSTPWAVDDAPADFLKAQVRGIVGLEIEISAIEGKWKVSQNRPEADRAGVAEGLASETSPSAADMRDLVRVYGGLE